MPKTIVTPTSSSGNSHAAGYQRVRSTRDIPSRASSSVLIHTTPSTPWAVPTGGATVSTDFQVVTGAFSSSHSADGVGRIPHRARVGAANIGPNRKYTPSTGSARRSGPHRKRAPIRAISVAKTRAITPVSRYCTPPYTVWNPSSASTNRADSTPRSTARRRWETES